MIRVEHIYKQFGDTTALHDISFEIPAGQYTALLGANGAGKTTLIRLLAGLSRPSSGTIQMNHASTRNRNQQRRALGVMSHAGFLYDDLTAAENLQFYGRMYGVGNLQERITDLLRSVDLLRRRHDPVRQFSRGMRQRLSLARALLHRPPILLLDEPFNGLDIYAAEMLKNLLTALIAADTTVLLTTHDLDFARSQAHQLMVLQNGKLVLNRPAEEMAADTLRKQLRGAP